MISKPGRSNMIFGMIVALMITCHALAESLGIYRSCLACGLIVVLFKFFREPDHRNWKQSSQISFRIMIAGMNAKIT
jgi:hypothetical protein